MKIISINKIIYTDNSKAYVMSYETSTHIGALKIQKKQFDSLAKHGVTPGPEIKTNTNSDYDRRSS